jgi:hypothetical protein
MFVLAGPILRRVDERCVAVWVALDSPGTVRLDVWLELQKASGGDRLFATSTAPLYSGTAPTIAVGKQLHVALVRVDFSNKPGLQPGQLYSYNLTFGDSDDLRSQGLLQDGPLAGPRGARPHLALGYDKDQLPGFSTVPEKLEDLVLVHGSCRNPVGYARDALAALDGIIRSHHQDGRGDKARPHQLFLTGDQIYADEALDYLLPALDDVAATWIGAEQLPVGGATWDADQANLPGGRRYWLCTSEARLSSDDSAGHILSFGEFAAMYLFSFSETLWPDDLPDPPLPAQHRERLFGPEDWDAIAKAWDPNSLPTGTAATLLDALKTAPPDDVTAQARVGLYAQLIAALGNLQPLEDAIRKAFATGDEAVARRTALRARLQRYRSALGHIRRAFANVPTYLICDDHEVTDDWNFTKDWQHRVLAQPLGRALLRNALLGYGIFQAWGNDPAAWDDVQSPGARLLACATRFPAAEAVSELEQIFGLTHLTGDGLSNPLIRWHFSVPGQRHHVRVLDTRTRRGYRGRLSPPSLLTPTAFDDQLGRLDDPVGPLPPGKDVLVVVSPAPVFSPAVIDEIMQPLGGAMLDVFAGRSAYQPRRPTGDEVMDLEAWPYDPDAFETLLERTARARRVVFLSGDIHFALSLQMAYWKKDGQPARFVQLVSSATSNEQPRVGVMERSSAAGQWLFVSALMPRERLGWNAAPGENNLVTMPPGNRFPPAYASRLGRSRLLLPTTGWPVMPIFSRAPDWSWRMSVLGDTRHDDSSHPDTRPVEAWPLPMPSDSRVDLNTYGKVAAIHGQAIDVVAPRSVVWAANIGVVRFERQSDGIYLRHELQYLLRRAKASDPHAPPDDDMKPYQAFTVHRTRLEPPGSDEQPPMVQT